MEFHSCQPIANGFNFYRSGKISSCCMKISPALEIANIGDEDVAKKILSNQTKIFLQHLKGNPPAPCKNCHSFIKKEWPMPFERKFSVITLNHYKKCNLNCLHCGYRKFDDNETDTPHEAVLDVIKKCIEENICEKKLHLEVGGGEPSLSAGIANIMKYALENSWTAIINSNGAKFSDVFAAGVNSGQFTLLLTPDAGSRETFAKIKGSDQFERTWSNIGQYMATTNGKAMVKFILEAGNRHDIPAMIETSRKYGVKKLVLSLDMNIRGPEIDEYLEKGREFASLAKENGLSVIRGAFMPPF